MFGLGMPEILLILAIALIVIGPQKLPEVAKTLGRAMGEFKRSAQDLKNSIDIETTVKEVTPKPGKKKLKEVIKDITADDPKSKPAQTGTEAAPPDGSGTNQGPELPQGRDADKAEAPAGTDTGTASPKA